MRRSGEEDLRVRPALGWIVDALNRYRVPYQVVGGLAARAHGARRPVFDVDLYVPFDRATAALEEIRPHIYWGPEHYVDEQWDLTYLKADFGGQKVELGNSCTHPRYFDVEAGRWEAQRVAYGSSVTIRVFGVEAEVMPKDELIRYKRRLGREVDLIDVEQLTTRCSTTSPGTSTGSPLSSRVRSTLGSGLRRIPSRRSAEIPPSTHSGE